MIRQIEVNAMFMNWKTQFIEMYNSGINQKSRNAKTNKYTRIIYTHMCIYVYVYICEICYRNLTLHDVEAD